MNRKWLVLLLGPAVLLAVWGVVALLGAQLAHSAPEPTTLQEENGELLRREVSRTVDSPSISFIDNPSPTCYRPVENTGACYITWNYLSVTASPSQYIISMTVSIDDALRAYHAGFFQTSMYIPGDMTGPGYQVTCGVPGSAGIPTLGMAYNYTVRARETGGLTAANYGAVTCPADVVKVYLPLARK